MRIKILIVSLIVFIINTILVVTNNYHVVDTFVYDLIMFFKSDMLTEIMKVISFLGNTRTITIFNIILVIFIVIFKKYKLFMITGTSIASGILNSTIKKIFRRSRPDKELALISQGGFSYPSGHTMISILFYGTIIYLLANSKLKHRKVFIIFFSGLAILIPLSRIYLGVHYFSDIVGGYSFGLFILTTTLTIYKKFSKE